MTNRPIPQQLDTLKQEAKSLLKAINAGSSEALSRTTPYFSDSLSLSLQNVQLVVAREYGFESWSKLKSHISRDAEEPAEQDRDDATPTREVDRQFRSTTEYLRRLFDEQTPELRDGRIRILSVARVPGVRAKIAVETLDSSINPVGACVGYDGERVQAVSKALDDERIDIVLWSENLNQYIVNALAPAEVKSVVVDAVVGDAKVRVMQNQYDVAIGKHGQNVGLASELCCCRIAVQTAD